MWVLICIEEYVTGWSRLKSTEARFYSLSLDIIIRISFTFVEREPRPLWGQDSFLFILGFFLHFHFFTPCPFLLNHFCSFHITESFCQNQFKKPNFLHQHLHYKPKFCHCECVRLCAKVIHFFLFWLFLLSFICKKLRRRNWATWASSYLILI